MLQKIQTGIIADEFFELMLNAEQRLELIEGQVIVMGTPIPEHQRLIRKLLLQLETLIPDGELFLSPLEIVLDEQNVPQPDLMWVAANSKCTIGEKCLYGAPDLIIEVFSPGTALYDKSTKFRLYEKHGVREYWMVDPIEKYIEVWQLIGDKFVQLGVFGTEETFTSAVLGDKVINVALIFS